MGKLVTRSLPALLAIMLCLIPSNAVAEAARPACNPYIGEQLVFSVGWEFINAGTATMNIRARPDGGYQLHTFARSNRFFDLFKKVRDTIISEGICRHGRMQSTVFDIEQHEHKYHADKKTRFLWQKNQEAYTQHNNTEIYDVPAGHLNVLDAFLSVRNMKLVKGKVIKIPVFDSRKTYEIHVYVLGREKLRAPWGGFVDCLVVEPKLLTGGIFSSKGKIKLWLTDDARHIPLKMTAKIKFGRIIARLKQYHANAAKL
ncbi:MAG: DUF3108 domain-containing protein [Mariprofundaceae bacterium]|nr:DUF3108 domain-containing protein [Mariprofundaceae bacterium]